MVETDDSKKAWIIVSICIGLAALLIAVIFLVSTTLIKDTDMKEGDRNIPSGGSGSGGGGGGEMVVPPAPGMETTGRDVVPTLPPTAPPLPPVGPPPVAPPPVGPPPGPYGTTAPPYPTITFATMTTTTESTTTTTTTTSTTTTTTTTTTTPPPPLLCSVGLIASLPSQFPPDKICDILIFTHVIVHERKIRVVENEASLEAFRKACAPYSETTCGLSFDVRYLSQDIFGSTEVRDQMNEMKTSRINHYGIMNMYGTKDIVTNYTQLSTQIISTLRSIIGQDRTANKIFIGVGFFYYNSSDSWDSLRYLAENTATTDVDIVVLITSVLSIPDRKQCITMPANALRSPNSYPPVMDKAFPTIESSFGTPGLLVAFSLQMGVLQYAMPLAYNTPIDALYKECTAFTVTDYSHACQIALANLNSEKTVVGFRNRQPNIFQSHDTLERMKEKAGIVMNLPNRRRNFTWFLLNVHLTDNTKRCLPDGPFSRVKGFREFLHQNY
ncbi:uncharacterized protein LOC144134425 [Amblyomma americanum]